MQDDDCESPLYQGLGACHELNTGKPRRAPRRKAPIGFLHSFIQTKAKKSPAAKKPTRRPRRK